MSNDCDLSQKKGRNRISSVYYGELKRSVEEEGDVSRLLEVNESIKDIRGGPFHTVVLTSKGKVFYTGNIYNSESLLEDECSLDFLQVNTVSIGKVISIRSSLNGVCLLTL